MHVITNPGQKVPILCWCANPEKEAIEQAVQVASLPFVYGKVCLMPDCLPEDTEVLTKIGFKLIKDLTYTDQVANIIPNTPLDAPNIFWESPKAIINRHLRSDEWINEFSIPRLRKSICVTNMHRMPFKDKLGIKSQEISETTKVSDYFWGGTGLKDVTTKTSLSDNELRLLVWIIGDGYIKTTHNTYKNTKYKDTDIIKWGLVKTRKIIRLKWILDCLGLIYYEHVEKKQISISLSKKSSTKYIEIIGFNKEYPITLLTELDTRQATILLNEALQVDGDFEQFKSNGSYRYNSKRKDHIDFIAALIAIHWGISNVFSRTVKTPSSNDKLCDMLYCGAISNLKTTKNRSGLHNSKIIKKKKDYNGNVVCLETSSGFFIARQNGLSFITGNCHLGYALPIGGVVACNSVISPAFVGVDIGCGMSCVKTSLQDIEQVTLKAVMSKTREAIPLGRNHHKKPQCTKEELFGEILVNTTKKDLPIIQKEADSATYQLASLGGGNHFIEFEKGNDGFIYVMLHSGSRNLGKKVCDYYCALALEQMKKWHSSVPQEWKMPFFPFEDALGQMYWNEMNLALEFAYKNRMLMLKRIMDILNEETQCSFHTPINIHHNYATKYKDNLILHRKGATNASEGTIGLIPGSQGTSSYIVRGKGNPNSFESCFPENTLILTNKGIISIKEVYENIDNYLLVSYDVINDNFVHTKIIEKSCIKNICNQYYIYQRNIRNKNYIESTNTHPFATFKNGKIEYSTIKEIIELENPVIIPYNVTLEKNETNNEIENDFYYLLGTILSDGHILDKEKTAQSKGDQYIRFSQVTTHKKIIYINYVKELFKKYFKRVYVRNYKGRISFFKKENRDIIGNDYITIESGREEVSLIKEFIKNNLYLDLSSKKIAAIYFLAGFLDGDGTTTKTKVAISLGKNGHFDFLITVFLNLGIVYKAYNNRENYMIEFYDKQLIESLSKICKRLSFEKIKQQGIYSEKNIFAKSLLNKEKIDYIKQKAKKNSLIGLDKIKDVIPKSLIHNRVSFKETSREEIDTYNFTLDKHNNYVVFSSQYTPLLVHNCSHGAGRKLSRTRACSELNLEEEKEKLDSKGILHAIRGKSDLEEAAGAYKDIDLVMSEQEDLVEILVKLEPLAVIKE